MTTLRKLIALGLGLLAASTGFARSHYIERPDGQIILQDHAKCSDGRFEATYVERRSGGGGMFGCWELAGRVVLLQWTLSIGPTGSALRLSRPAEQLDAPTSLLDLVQAPPAAPVDSERMLNMPLSEFRNTLVDVGLCSACADHVGRTVRHSPKGRCAQLTLAALSGGQPERDALAAFPKTCHWDYDKKAPVVAGG